MATGVEVEVNTNTPGINARLDKAGAIAGKVSTAGGNPLVGDVHVGVYEYGAEVKQDPRPPPRTAVSIR